MAKIAPKTTFSWNNQSAITPLTSAYTGAPVIYIASTSDKGPTKMQLISGSHFFKQYVTDKKAMYSRHGQPLLQAAAVAEAGGQILFKRIIADDSVLANAIVSIKATKVPDTPGPNPGDPSIPPADGTPKVILKIQVDTVTDAETITDVKTFAATLESTSNPNDKVFPLFIITDNGRGTSAKKFRLIPDYSTARELSFMQYTLRILENTSTLENMNFALDQSVQYTGKNYGIDAVVKNNSAQVQSFTYEENILALAEYVGSILKIEASDLLNTDLLFGTSRLGIANPEITIDVDSINLNNPLGVNLMSGSNGSFTDKPIEISTQDIYILIL